MGTTFDIVPMWEVSRLTQGMWKFFLSFWGAHTSYACSR
jgi:hypothetical protein